MKFENDLQELDADMDSANLSNVRFIVGNPNIEEIEGHLFYSDVPPKDCKQLVFLDIPNKIVLCDLCHFITKIRSEIAFSQIVQTPDLFIIDVNEDSLSTYALLIQFYDPESTVKACQTFDKRRFNPLERELCRARYLVGTQTVQGGFQFPDFDPNVQCSVCLYGISGPGFHGSHAVMSVLCKHLFHVDCIQSWADVKGCPICRYMTSPQVTSVCQTCRSNTDLWLCVICGEVGCGRHVEAHALEHYESTGHIYSINVETGKVWDYSSEEYVDRVIASQADRKLVASGKRSNDIDIQVQLNTSMKLESMATEYTMLLKEETKKQRQVYNAKINEQRREFKQARRKLEAEIADEENIIDNAFKNYDSDLKSFDDQIREMREANQKLVDMIRIIRKDQSNWSNQTREAEKSHAKSLDEIRSRCAYELADLKANLRDLKAHVKTQEKVGSEKVAEVSIGRRKKKKKKKR